MSDFDQKIAQLYDELHAGRLTEKEFEQERERLMANLEFQEADGSSIATTDADEANPDLFEKSYSDSFLETDYEYEDFKTEAFSGSTEAFSITSSTTDYQTQDSFLKSALNSEIPNTTDHETNSPPLQSTLPIDPPPPEMVKILGQYYLLEQIGEGGMGVVYRATHKVKEFAQMTGDVAIKLLHPQFTQNPEFRLRFMAEANFGRTIQHPNIVRIYDVLVDQESYALVMDLVEGQSLREKIKHATLSIDEALEFLAPVAKAIDYLNEKGIVHRDIKPENIIIKEDRTPIILDMGIAKGGDINSETQTDQAIGTPAYMAPEQIDAKNITGAADRYALGMTFYRCLTGIFPWPKKIGRSELISRKFNDFLDPPPDVPPNVSDAIMKMLVSNPEGRFETCQDFLDALRNPNFSIRKKRGVNENTISITDAIDTLAMDTPVPPCYKIQLEGEISILKNTGFLSIFGKGTPKLVKKQTMMIIDMISIPAGSFTMGSKYGNQDEKPPHAVLISDHYFLSQTPITQAQWELVMGSNPCKTPNPDHPVEQVSWNDCIDFCNALSKREGLSPAYQKERHTIIWNSKSNGYRLPTEAEWAKAARGQASEAGAAGDDIRFAGSQNAEEVAWFDLDAPQKVGQKKPNDFELYDMNGNVWEWCWDFYDADIYKSENRLNPRGPENGRHRVTRGGSWKSLAKLSRVSLRGQSDPIKRSATIGLRIARNGSSFPT